MEVNEIIEEYPNTSTLPGLRNVLIADWLKNRYTNVLNFLKSESSNKSPDSKLMIVSDCRELYAAVRRQSIELIELI